MAFIGLGTMGSRMAARLSGGDGEGGGLIVHNRDRAKAGPLLDRGARWADTPAAAAREADLVFTMLTDPAAVEAVAHGPDGLLSGLAPGTLWIDCSTVHPALSRDLAREAGARGARFLDAPVSGSKGPAEAGQLIFLVGGDPGDLEKARPRLLAMGQAIIHAGPVGSGSSLKLVVNSLLGQAMLAFAEALALGEALGLSRALLLERLPELPVSAPVLKAKRAKLERGDTAAEFALRLMRKDLHLAAVAAYEAGQPLPALNAAKEAYGLAQAAGRGGEDFSAIVAAYGRGGGPR